MDEDIPSTHQPTLSTSESSTPGQKPDTPTPISQSRRPSPTIVQTNVTKTLREWVKPACKYVNKVWKSIRYSIRTIVNPPKDPDSHPCRDPHFHWPRPSSELVLTNKSKNQHFSHIWISTAPLHWPPARSLEHDVSSAVAIGFPFLAETLHKRCQPAFERYMCRQLKSRTLLRLRLDLWEVWVYLQIVCIIHTAESAWGRLDQSEIWPKCIT